LFRRGPDLQGRRICHIAGCLPAPITPSAVSGEAVPKGKSAHRPARLTEAARAPTFPPSLGKVRGLSNSAIEEEDNLRRLEQIMRDLPVQPGAERKIADYARELCDMLRFARYSTGIRRKTRTTARLKQLLREIESGSKTLLKRLNKAPSNVFQAWADTIDVVETDRQQVTYEWLQLKGLLEIAAERAQQAALAVDPKQAAPENRGRRSDQIAASITFVAANAYEQLTGLIAVRSIDSDSGEACGKFHEFLTTVFNELGIKASPEASNRQLQSELRDMGTSQQIGHKKRFPP
jgi:hypothetical protein